jgi:hypothetical protein
MCGVTSLRDISIVGGHVIRCFSDETIWPLWVERPRKSLRDTSVVGMHAMRCYGNKTIWPLRVERPRRGDKYLVIRMIAPQHYRKNGISFILFLQTFIGGITITIKRRYHVKHLYYRR